MQKGFLPFAPVLLMVAVRQGKQQVDVCACFFFCENERGGQQVKADDTAGKKVCEALRNEVINGAVQLGCNAFDLVLGQDFVPCKTACLIQQYHSNRLYIA